MCSNPKDLRGKMFIFPQKTNTAHVRMTPEKDGFSAVTVCHRSFTDLVRDHSLFSMSTPSVDNAFLTFVFKGPKFCPHIQNSRVDFEQIDYAPNKWQSICTTWDSATGLVQVWLNGQPLTFKYITDKPITAKPIIVLGQDQDKHGGGFDVNQSFEGMMTDVHMWDYVLSPCEIQRFMRGQYFTPGNVLNWADLNYETNGRVLIHDKQTDLF